MPRSRPTSPSSKDGRVRRGVQNRDRIVDAVIELVRGGTPRPSADQIAAVAGTGSRTVFRQFSDMEGLFSAVQSRVQAEIVPLIDPAPIEGSARERARELVRRRAAVFERLSPFRLSGMPHRQASAVIRRGDRALDDYHRRQLTTTFAAELRRRPADLVEALDAVTSFEMWDRLRSGRHLARGRASEVMVSAVLAVLGASSP